MMIFAACLREASIVSSPLEMGVKSVSIVITSP
jgi:hypothetical protein